MNRGPTPLEDPEANDGEFFSKKAGLLAGQGVDLHARPCLHLDVLPDIYYYVRCGRSGAPQSPHPGRSRGDQGLPRIYLPFCCLPEATGKMRHIRSDVMANRLGPSLTRMLAIVRFLLGVLLLTGIAAATWDKMIEAWKIWEYEGEGTIRVPMAPVRTTIFICSAIAAVLYFRLLGKVFKLFPRDDRTK